MLTDEQAIENLAVNLSRVLAARKWEPIDLAKAIKTESETIDAAKMRVSRCLNRKHKPGPAHLANFAEALGVTVDMLLGNPKKKSLRVG